MANFRGRNSDSLFSAAEVVQDSADRSLLLPTPFFIFVDFRRTLETTLVLILAIFVCRLCVGCVCGSGNI